MTHIFNHFELRIYKIYIEGLNPEIHQSLTKTSCQYNDFSYIPQEEPLSVVVWKNAFHDATSFHNIGTYPIQRVGDYVLIPPLNIGGAIQLEQNDGNFIQPDNNYIILRNDSFVNASRVPDVYSCKTTKTSSDEHAALLTGHLVATFDIIFQNYRALGRHTFNLQSEILHLRQWAVRYFSHTARTWLAKDYGTIVIPAGDTLISYQCKRHVTYSINWKRQINNT